MNLIEIGAYMINKALIKYISKNGNNSATVFLTDGTYLDIPFENQQQMLKTLRDL